MSFLGCSMVCFLRPLNDYIFIIISSCSRLMLQEWFKFKIFSYSLQMFKFSFYPHQSKEVEEVRLLNWVHKTFKCLSCPFQYFCVVSSCCWFIKPSSQPMSTGQPHFHRAASSLFLLCHTLLRNPTPLRSFGSTRSVPTHDSPGCPPERSRDGSTRFR